MILTFMKAGQRVVTNAWTAEEAAGSKRVELSYVEFAAPAEVSYVVIDISIEALLAAVTTNSYLQVDIIEEGDGEEVIY